MFFSVPGVKKIYYSNFFPDFFRVFFYDFSGFFLDVFYDFFRNFFTKKWAGNTESRVRQRVRESRVRRRFWESRVRRWRLFQATRTHASRNKCNNRVRNMCCCIYSSFYGSWSPGAESQAPPSHSADPGFPSSHSWIPGFRRLTLGSRIPSSHS